MSGSYIDFNKVDKLSDCEKSSYFKELKKYYLNLPFDIDEMHKKMKRYLWTIKTFSPLVKTLVRPTVVNKEIIPDGDSIIFTANHLDSFDQFPMIAGAIGYRPLRALMQSTLFSAKEYYRGYLFDFLGSAVPINVTTEEGREIAQNMMIQLVLYGSSVLYFPEGTRGTKKKYYDKSLPLEFKNGAIVNAMITGATIVPISINNNYKLFKKNQIIIRVNEPMRIKCSENIDNATKELRKRIIDGIKQNQDDGFFIRRKNNDNRWVMYKI